MSILDERHAAASKLKRAHRYPPGCRDEPEPVLLVLRRIHPEDYAPGRPPICSACHIDYADTLLVYDRGRSHLCPECAAEAGAEEV